MRERIEFLSTAERTMMTADALGLTTDLDIAVAITYRDLQSTTFSPSTGAQVPVYTDYNITVVQNDLPEMEVQASDGLYQMGDFRLIIPRSVLAISPNKEDIIVIDGITYSIISVGTDPIRLLWRIVARKMT